MAITRRQFVTSLSALAAAAGMGQAEFSRIIEAFGAVTPSLGGTAGKPRVIWIHGAECTGCSTSLLGILESGSGLPLYGDKDTELIEVLASAGVTVPLTLQGGLRVDGALVNIADVVIDVIDLQYHETVMGMGGDLAAQWLHDFMKKGGGAQKAPFVLVVEGALQKKTGGGAWNDSEAASQAVSWCSVGMSDDYDHYATPTKGFDLDMPEVVEELAVMANCLAIVPIGQCATYGGYAGCKPNLASDPEFDVKKSQSGATGVFEHLSSYSIANPTIAAAAAKVVNVPGCPTNPFWFVLTVVALMVDIQAVLGGNPPALNVLTPGLAPNPGALDSLTSRRLKVAYPIPVHSAWCPRYKYYTKGIYATKPGQKGCLQKLGCKGLYTRSLCGVHGWNNHQPQNGTASVTPAALGGGHCTTAGHPCMGCTEPGYPDRFVPFVKL